jgi:hypothetical protein
MHSILVSVTIIDKSSNNPVSYVRKSCIIPSYFELKYLIHLVLVNMSDELTSTNEQTSFNDYSELGSTFAVTFSILYSETGPVMLLGFINISWNEEYSLK